MSLSEILFIPGLGEKLLVADFGGTNGFIEFDDTVGDYTDGFSFSARVKIRSLTNSPRIFSKRGGFPDSWELYLNTLGRINVYTGTNYQFTGAVVTENVWAYVGLIVDGANTRAFINGSQVGSAISPTIGSNATASRLGRFTSVYTNGQMSDIKIFNAALTDSQMAFLHGQSGSDPTTTWLASWYRLDGNAIDSGNLGVNGTISGDVTFVKFVP